MSGEQHRISPQARELLDWERAHRDDGDRDVTRARQRNREFARRFGGAAEAVASVEHVDAGGVPARLYQPAGGERDALVWFHGGGWRHGDLDDHDSLSRALAKRAGCAVLNV